MGSREKESLINVINDYNVHTFYRTTKEWLINDHHIMYDRFIVTLQRMTLPP